MSQPEQAPAFRRREHVTHPLHRRIHCGPPIRTTVCAQSLGDLSDQWEIVAYDTTLGDTTLLVWLIESKPFVKARDDGFVVSVRGRDPDGRRVVYGKLATSPPRVTESAKSKPRTDDMVRALWADGLTMVVIAERLGLSRASVPKILHRLGLADRGSAA